MARKNKQTKGFSIRARVMTGFSICVGILIVTGIVFLYNISYIMSQVNTLSTVIMPTLDSVAELENAMNECSILARDALRKNVKVEYEKDIVAIRENVDRIRAEILPSFSERSSWIEEEYLAELVSAVEENADILIEICDSMGFFSKDNAVIMLENTYTPKADALRVLFSNTTVTIMDSVHTLEAETVVMEEQLNQILIATVAFGILFSMTWGFILAHKIMAPLRAISKVATEISKGNLGINFQFRSRDEFGVLADDMRLILSTVNRYVKDISRIMKKVSEGDLTVQITSEYVGDFSHIKRSIQNTVDSLRDTMECVDKLADQVLKGAEQVSDGARSLSDGTSQQASSIEELNARLDDFSQDVRNIAEQAAAAREISLETGEKTDIGINQLQEMTTSMGESTKASREIHNVIKAINDIALKTKLLSLNAAIEAARAGSYGKGFSVVAQEVSNLASKSGESADGTTILIERTIGLVGQSSDLARGVADQMGEIGTVANKSIEIIGKIADSARKESVVIGEITSGLDEISSVVQSTTSTAEQSAAASEELFQQANSLKALIEQFKIDE